MKTKEKVLIYFILFMMIEIIPKTYDITQQYIRICLIVIIGFIFGYNIPDLFKKSKNNE